MDEVSYRVARLSDHDAILDISPDVYGGMDYIMNQLHSLLVDPDYYCFLGETTGKTIAFLVGTLQLCGRKLTLKAGRVREGWRGQGIYGRLLKFLLGYMKQKYPGVDLEEFSTNDVNQSLSKVYADNKYNEFMRRIIANYHLKKTLPGDCPPDVKELGICGLKDILGQEEVTARIFPTRMYLVWDMYDPVLSEIQYMEKMNPTILVTLDNTDDVSELEKVTALTTMSSYGTLKGQLYLLQIHFPINTLLTTATELSNKLILGNLSKIAEITEDDLLVISVDETFKEPVLEAAKTVDLQRTKVQYANILIGFNRPV